MNVTRAAVIAALLATLVPGRGEAAPVACVPGTLSDYFALSDACTGGAFQFQNFVQLTTQPAGSSPISPDAVQVMPVASGLAFGVDVSASAGELLEILFGYDVTGSGIAGAGLSLSGASAAGDGAVTAVKNLCEGGRFDPGELTGPGAEVLRGEGPGGRDALETFFPEDLGDPRIPLAVVTRLADREAQLALFVLGDLERLQGSG